MGRSVNNVAESAVERERAGMETGTPQLIVEDHGAVVRIVLNRPEALNALTDEIVAGLERVLPLLHERDSVRAVVLAGAGRAFCAGSDVRAMQARPRRNALTGDCLHEARATERARLSWGFENTARLMALPKPTVAALHGPVAGAGLALAAACDFRIAGSSTQFLAAYARLGLPGDWGLTRLLPELIGLQPARRLLLRSTALDAAGALDLQLADEVVDDDEVDARALAGAGDLAAGPTRAFAEMKRLLGTDRGVRERIADEIEATLRCQETTDYAEGVEAFAQRRAPVFGGQ